MEEDLCPIEGTGLFDVDLQRESSQAAEIRTKLCMSSPNLRQLFC